MLSIFSNIKNRIRDIINKQRIHKRLRNYQLVVADTNITVDFDNMSEDGNDRNHIDHDHATGAPPPSPVVTIRLFNTEFDETLVKKDYELQHLLQHIRYDISNVTLESRFETLVNAIPNASDIFKIKMKLLYIIIANDQYRDLFEEKKHYRSIKVNQYVGVFRYNDYIIRIDDCPFSFMNEIDVTKAMTRLTIDNPRIIRPFLIYTNTRQNRTTNDICECRKPRCDCKYTDNAEHEYPAATDSDTNTVTDTVMNTVMNTDTILDSDLAHSCFKKLRDNTISFSIQYYVKDSVSLYTWVRENLATDIYNRFSAIQRIFFVELFHQCALLLRDIHRVNIVHGDIKPDNILIYEDPNFNINHPERCKNFTVYLIDFGLSGFHKIGVGTGGTVPYCHPEFKNITDTIRSSKYNWKKIDVKHDVWSLGISFLTMYIYRDFYSYYHKYPNYFFLKNGYVSSLIMDVITDTQINKIFTKILSEDCIPSDELCSLLEEMSKW